MKKEFCEKTTDNAAVTPLGTVFALSLSLSLSLSEFAPSLFRPISRDRFAQKAAPYILKKRRTVPRGAGPVFFIPGLFRNPAGFGQAPGKTGLLTGFSVKS
jgi:hypothetical protein